MPFLSIQQQKWGHTAEGQKALGGKQKVAEWDAATNYKTLPAKAASASPPKKIKTIKPKMGAASSLGQNMK